MLPHEFGNLAKLGRPIASAARETDGVEPELGDVPVALDVDMGRLAGVARIEEEPTRTSPKDRRHSLQVLRGQPATLTP
jgi:hypothetical protein